MRLICLPTPLRAALLATALAAAAGPARADGTHGHAGGIATKSAKAVHAPFDVVHTRIAREDRALVFHMQVSGKAGRTRPTPSGKLAGSRVFSYVWPTSFDPAEVSLEATVRPLDFLAISAGAQGYAGAIIALTADLTREEHRSKGMAMIGMSIGATFPEGSQPRLPKTWPGLPLLIDSPGWSPSFERGSVNVRVPFDNVSALQSLKFDGVTAALRVNASMHAPLLCVAQVFKVASGDLSLPGQVDR